MKPISTTTSPSRRDLLRGSLGLLSMAYLPEGIAEAANGEHVWGEMTQEELDAAYSQGPWAPNWQEVLGRYAKNSDIARSRLGEPQTFAYGDSAIETLDFYSAKGSSAPAQVYVRGGAWVVGNVRDYAFLAEPFVNAGAHFIAIEYASVDNTDAKLMPLANQVRRAVAWIHRNATRLKIDPDQVFLSGHSAGAHLAAVAMTTDWTKEFGLPADVVKGGLLCSGMFDLEPVSLSSRREYVDFDEQTVRELSPQRHLAQFNTPAIVAHGTLETPEFQRQSRDFATAARAGGKQVELLVAENYNHFEIIETLANPYGLLGAAALRQMNLV